MLKLKPYKEVLRMSKEKIDDALAPVRTNRARKQAELEIAKMEEKLVSLEARINELCSEKDLLFDRIIAALDEYALTERKIKQFNTIIAEMFPKK